MGEVTQKDVLDAFEKSKDRKKIKNTELAPLLNIEPTAISNWFNRGFIPEERLTSVIKVMEDYRFACVVAEYLTGAKFYSTKRVEDTPYARYFSQIKEEDDRKKLDPEFVLLMGKRKEDRTDSDHLKIKQFIKELDEEIEEKVSFKAAILDEWDLSN